MPHDTQPLQIKPWLHPRYWPLWIAFGMIRMVSYLPLAWIFFLGRRLGDLLYWGIASRRRVSRTNIRMAYPDYDEKQIRQLQRDSYHSLGISIFETALAWWWPREKLRQIFSVEGIEHLERALARGKGVIILTGHFTLLEVGAHMMAMCTPLMAVYKKAHNPMFEYFLFWYRNAHCEGLIPNTSVRSFIRGLRGGYSLWYAPDQDFAAQDIVFTPFLGGVASTLTSTVRMAKLTSAAVVSFYPQRLPGMQGYRLVFLPEMENFPGDDELADSARVNAEIEKLVRLNPAQYAWIHKRFKTQPDGKPSIY